MIIESKRQNQMKNFRTIAVRKRWDWRLKVNTTNKKSYHKTKLLTTVSIYQYITIKNLGIFKRKIVGYHRLLRACNQNNVMMLLTMIKTMLFKNKTKANATADNKITPDLKRLVRPNFRNKMPQIYLNQNLKKILKWKNFCNSGKIFWNACVRGSHLKLEKCWSVFRSFRFAP